MEFSDTPKSGDGPIDNVDVIMSVSHPNTDCHQKFDSEEAKDIHVKRFHDHAGQSKETGDNGSCGAMQLEGRTAISLNLEHPSSELDVADIECTICMETISEETVLPCQCKLHYCPSCWDTALANSFSQCGQARCPSCRALVRVDFDDEKHCLVFAPETMDMTYSAEKELLQRIERDYRSQLSGPDTEHSREMFLLAHEHFQTLNNMKQMRNGTIEKLRRQARPAQIQILKQFGEANPGLLAIRENASNTLAKASVAELKNLMKGACVDSRGCLEKAELVERLTEKADARCLCSAWASQRCEAPNCVCGSALQRVSLLDRFRNHLGSRATNVSDADVQRAFDMLQSHATPFVFCDICEKNLPLAKDSFIWTCAKRDSTMLHATSYDICDQCFSDSASL